MYQRAHVHRRKLCSGLSSVYLLLLFAISNAKASPLAPPLLGGTLLFNLTPPVDFVDPGTTGYSSLGRHRVGLIALWSLGP